MFYNKIQPRAPTVQTPPTALDLDRTAFMGPPVNVDMFDMMGDNCPRCGGNCMRVGDYVCFGVCYNCFTRTETA